MWVHSGILNLVFYELFSCKHIPRGESDTKSIAQINTSTEVFPGDWPIEGKQSLNKVWGEQEVPDGNQKFRAHQSHLHAHISGTHQTPIND